MGFTTIPRIAPEVTSPQKDLALTFAESNVTVTHTGTAVVGGSLRFRDEAQPPYTGDTTRDQTDDSGLRFVPNENLSGLTARFYDGAAGLTTAYLRDNDAGDLLATVDVTGMSGGDPVTFTQSLTAGTTYQVTADAGGATFTEAYDSSGSTSQSFPYFDITSGYSGSASGTAFMWQSLTGHKSTATATVEWPYPADVLRWDAVKHQLAPDGATVSVAVEEDQAGGWTQIQTDVKRGDLIGADPANNVRLRVDLSRSDPTNNPTVDALTRAYVV